MDKELKKKRIIVGAAIFLFVALTVVLGIYVGKALVKYAAEPQQFRDWVDSHGAWGVPAYAGVTFLQVVLAVIPGEPLEILGGYAFGAFWGTVICIAAQAAGSLFVFALVRRYGMKVVRLFFSEEKVKKVRFLKSTPKRDVLFLVIFSLPGVPKDLLCYFAGLTDIKLPVWAIICTLGRVPAVVTSTVGGSALGEKSYIFAAGVFAVTLALSAGGLIAYNAVLKKHGGGKDTENAKD
ncbi:MAG: TVP38/TMEM64 family protein [Clostridia bacterium]|nr:TVP38/TMEM64 family protein [Clostridia bacterium]